MDRRQVLKGAVTGMLTLWTSPLARASQQTAAGNGVRRLTDKIAMVDGGGTNVVAFSTGDGLLLVDSGVPKYGDRLVAALKGMPGVPGVAGDSKVHTLFNTHYHLDQTGNNGEEQIDYGYLVTAHTGGDIYVYFKDSNVLAVGDVASPVKDPELDWITGGWIGGRVDAMDLLLKISNEQTKIVPGSGPIMTRAEFKAERELMEEVRQRLFKQVREGEGPQEMLEGGVLKGLARTWKDPYKFLYAACKGLWGNHNKLDPNVV